jgi:hypothetical protein
MESKPIVRVKDPTLGKGPVQGQRRLAPADRRQPRNHARARR